MFLPNRWGALRSADFAEPDADQVVAVWPLGATEQHGPHLPVEVDTVLADAMVSGAMRRLDAGTPVLVLPTLSVGLSTEHQLYAGTLTLSTETTLRVLRETGESVARAGVRKLLLFNAHGGHVSAMDLAARELRAMGMTVFHTSYEQLPLGAALEAFDATERRYGVHAGEMETSMMLALDPQRVRMDLAQDFVSNAQARVQAYPLLGQGHSRMGWHVQDLNPNGAVGSARRADAARGQALLDAVSEQLSILLRQLVALSPLS
ncbi:MAG: creatininase family protein [Alphaproteobacteria bacterium]|nr:creatininase family protein [Alphaproteobacteria bacterium]